MISNVFLFSVQTFEKMVAKFTSFLKKRRKKDIMVAKKLFPRTKALLLKAFGRFLAERVQKKGKFIQTIAKHSSKNLIEARAFSSYKVD